MKLKSTFYCLVAIAIWMLPCLLPPLVSAAETLFDFASGTQEWLGNRGPTQHVDTPSEDKNGSLRASVSLTGRGWSDNEYDSPEINMDFSGFSEVRYRIFVPDSAPYGLRVEPFAKSGSGWLWGSPGWLPLQKGRWNDVALPISVVSHPAEVRVIGLKIGANLPFKGSVFIDSIQAIPVSFPMNVGETEVSIRITDIVENQVIKGKVFGLNPGHYSDYKIVVYVKTDRWYIHPYERGGIGYSHALIDVDGSWEICTVKRDFPADKVAALLMKHDKPTPSSILTLDNLEYQAKVSQPGKGKL